MRHWQLCLLIKPKGTPIPEEVIILQIFHYSSIEVLLNYISKIKTSQGSISTQLCSLIYRSDLQVPQQADTIQKASAAKRASYPRRHPFDGPKQFCFTQARARCYA